MFLEPIGSGLHTIDERRPIEQLRLRELKLVAAYRGIKLPVSITKDDLLSLIGDATPDEIRGSLLMAHRIADVAPEKAPEVAATIEERRAQLQKLPFFTFRSLAKAAGVQPAPGEKWPARTEEAIAAIIEHEKGQP